MNAGNASRHGWAPKADIHRHGRPDRYAFSRNLLADRNMDEGVNSELEQRGFGGSGVYVPKWVGMPEHIRWFCYARLLTVNLRRLVEADGTLAATKTEADQLGHLTAPDPGPEEIALLVTRNEMELALVAQPIVGPRRTERWARWRSRTAALWPPSSFRGESRPPGKIPSPNDSRFLGQGDA